MGFFVEVFTSPLLFCLDLTNSYHLNVGEKKNPFEHNFAITYTYIFAPSLTSPMCHSQVSYQPDNFYLTSASDFFLPGQK